MFWVVTTVLFYFTMLDYIAKVIWVVFRAIAMMFYQAVSMLICSFCGVLDC